MRKTLILLLSLASCGSPGKAEQPAQASHGDSAPEAQAPVADEPATAPIGGLSGSGTGEVKFGEGFGTREGKGTFRDSSAPTLRLGRASVEPAGAKAEIQRHMRRRLRSLQACFASQQNKTPKMRGSVSIAFALEADGSVKSFSASGLNEHAGLHDCLRRIVSADPFASTAKNKATRVEYILAFL